VAHKLSLFLGGIAVQAVKEIKKSAINGVFMMRRGLWIESNVYARIADELNTENTIIMPKTI
jgi:hypothetical protein